jgi:large subunit ribosomal protein L24e
MTKCSFCKQELPAGGGILFSKRDGSTFHFCSSKCEKNFNLGRNPRKIKWITKKKKGQKEKEEGKASK